MVWNYVSDLSLELLRYDIIRPSLYDCCFSPGSTHEPAVLKTILSQESHGDREVELNHLNMGRLMTF